MTQNERDYPIFCRPEVPGDVISGENEGFLREVCLLFRKVQDVRKKYSKTISGHGVCALVARGLNLETHFHLGGIIAL